MAIPYRGSAGHGTYFITTSCWEKRPLLQTDRMACLFIETLLAYRDQKKYLLHEFVVMPNHFHLLVTPLEESLERCLQFIKGGFSHRARKEFGLRTAIWQTSFYDHRVRDAAEYDRARSYIHQNPVRRGLVERAEDWPYGSACGRFSLDDVPQGLKPLVLSRP